MADEHFLKFNWKKKLVSKDKFASIGKSLNNDRPNMI